ncbi:acyl-CoA thioesterase [Microbacterium kribbense]|uniref:Acyl-CoA thioesterase n=1 Tax=Microbacterium kribbense TaxID=433645 RepID=A0ABP7GTH2_9MICO
MTEGEQRRLHIPIPLRWGDLDAYNHVNNVTMLKLLEEARVRALWRPLAGEHAPSTAVMDATLDSGVLTLIARQEIEYRAPVPYQREPLDVQMWFSKVIGSSLEVCYEVCSPREAAPADSPPAEAAPAEGTQTVYVRATTTVVKVDAASGRPIRISEVERAAWEPYLGPAVHFSHRR